jgi:hypothetical protein
MAVPSRWISHVLPTDQPVSLSRTGERAIPADEADANVRRGFRQHFAGSVAEAALIEDEEVEAGEVRRDQRELFAQGSLRQAQRGVDGEPVSLDVEEHEGAVVAPAGEVKSRDENANKVRAHTLPGASGRR